MLPATEHSAANTEPTRGWSRLDSIDLLRGIAILFVLLNHVNVRLAIAKVPYTEGLPKALTGFFIWNGQRGVRIFFVVSGYLITSTALRRWSEPARVRLRDFYTLRLARIAPLLVALVSVLGILHYAGVADYVIKTKAVTYPRALLAALTFHINWLEASHGYLPGSWDILWSLSVEEVFYLFFPLLCILTRSRRILAMELSVFVILGPFGRSVFSGGNELWSDYSWLSGMDAIALGCLTALICNRRQFPAPALRVAGISGWAILIFTLGFARFAYQSGLGPLGLDMSLLAIGTCFVITALTGLNWQAPSILHPLLTLGRLSYEVYMTHMFMVFLCFHAFLNAGKPMWAVPLFFVTAILLARLLGGLVSRRFSEPANHWLRGRLLTRRYNEVSLQ